MSVDSSDLLTQCPAKYRLLKNSENRSCQPLSGREQAEWENSAKILSNTGSGQPNM